uniref:Uncharacterized protein n=1 Tax=Romanomermis culicivorax TaxID=13658 RepID=A0A915JJB5_ROMCU
MNVRKVLTLKQSISSSGLSLYTCSEIWQFRKDNEVKRSRITVKILSIYLQWLCNGVSQSKLRVQCYKISVDSPTLAYDMREYRNYSASAQTY